MKSQFAHAAWSAPLCLSLFLGGCGGFSMWPFGGDKAQERSRIPSNASEFRCNDGKRFYLRNLDNGAAAWIIYADREVRLDKVAAASGSRYSNGIAVLNVSGNEATLEDGPAISFAGCKKAGNP